MPSVIRGNDNFDSNTGAAYRGAVITHSVGQSHTTSGAWQILVFDSEDIDTEALHDTATNNSRITVPTGVTKVRLKGQIDFASNATGNRGAFIYKNSASLGSALNQKAAISGLATQIQVRSKTLIVSAGEYFELAGYQSSGGALSMRGDDVIGGTWLEMEIVE